MKTHRFDTLSFLAGLAITVIGLVFLLLPGIDDIVDLLTDSSNWFWPVVFIAVGIGILAPLAVSGSKQDDTAEDQSEGIGAS